MEFIHTRDLNPIIDSPRETREIPKSGRSQVRKHQETSLVRRRRKNINVKRPITSQKTHVLCVPDKAETSINAVTRPTNVSYTKIDQRGMIVQLSKEERQEKMSKNRQSPNPNKTERERKKSFLQTVSKQKDEDTSHKQER